MIAMDYNPANASFTNKQQMQECSGVSTASIDQNCDCYIEASKSMNPLSTMYVRTTALPSTSPIHLYDLGLLQVATAGCAASANIGELYISYDISYSKPIAISGLTVPSARFVLNSTSTSNYVGTTQTKSCDLIGLTFGTSTVTMPAGVSGNFLCIYTNSGTAATCTNVTPAITNGVLMSIWGPPSNFTYYCMPPSGTSSTNSSTSFAFSVTNPSTTTTITFATGTIPTSSTGCLYITQCNSGFS